MDFTNPQLISFLKNSLAEDIGDGDHSSLAAITQGTKGESKIWFKDSGILAGIQLAEQVLKLNDPGVQIKIYHQYGEFIDKGTLVAEISGSVHGLLASERLLLNLMQHLSGIATQTYEVVQMVKAYPCQILDTRKTTPGLRLLEKWAVKIGGGQNHRFGLYDMIMLKDNHNDSAGGIKNALARTKEYLRKTGKSLKIEVETRNLLEVETVLAEGGADRIMLDNFSPELCKEAVALIHGKAETEASGGITKENIVAYAQTGVNFISLGYLTHSVKSLDISMKTRCQ